MADIRNGAGPGREILLEHDLAMAVQILRDIVRVSEFGAVTDAEFRFLATAWARRHAEILDDSEFDAIKQQANRRVEIALGRRG